MKYEQLQDYSFKNCIDTIDKDELSAMRLYITCAADIMKYDSAAVDFDELMKYILNTHRNFIPLTPLSTGNYNDNTEIGIVKTDYIDHIVKEIFELEPQHPDIAQLTERGYCENNGYYNYKKVFNVYFVTAIDSIEAVYEIGNNVYYIVFGDTYTERGVSIREYSYMILKGKNKSYKILKIDMGGELPSEHEVIKYAGIDSEYKNDENNMYSGTGINKKIKIVFTAFLITTGGAVIWYKRRKL
jgi:ribosomal protein S8E